MSLSPVKVEKKQKDRTPSPSSPKIVINLTAEEEYATFPLTQLSEKECNSEAKGHSPICFEMQPNHGGCLLCCYTGYLGIFSSFLV